MGMTMVRQEQDIKRYDIWIAELPENTIGSVQRGKRPVLIVQNDIGNKYSPTITVVAITSKNKKPMPTHVKFKADECGLITDSTVMFETITSIERSQLHKKINSAPRSYYDSLNHAYGVHTGLI